MKLISLKFLFFLIIYFSYNAYASKIEIITNVGGEIITNVDIENEYKKIVILNNRYSEIEKDKMQEFAKQLLVKEIIKKKELQKYFKLGTKNEVLKNKIKEIYINSGFENEESFVNFINKEGIKLDDLYNKIEIELLWNQLIYQIYKDKIVINKSNIKQKILDSLEDQKILNLSELVFTYEKRDEIKKKYAEINESIERIGFEKSVLIYSTSVSRENSGNIGWIEEFSLSKEILSEIRRMKIGDISRPILVANGVLIIKLNDIKKSEINNQNIDMELNKLIELERNKQLNNFSLIYYNKIKENISIDEK